MGHDKAIRTLCRQQDRIHLLSYLTNPYLIAYAGFLGVMVALSFAIPGIHSLSMSLRWPVLGGVAILGAMIPIFARNSGWTAAHILMAVFLATLGLSTAYSSEPTYTVQRFISVVMLFCATQVGLYAFSRNWISVVRITDLLWFIGAGLVLAGVVFRAVGGEGEGGERYEGLHSRATGAGTYAALFLPIAIYQASYRLRGIGPILGWGLVALFLAQSLLAGARAAFLVGLFVALALGFAYNIRRAVLATAFAIMLAPIPFLLNPTLMEKAKDKAERLIRAQSFGTFTGRLDRWVFGIEQWQRKPLFGHGFGVSRTLAGQEDPVRFKIQPGDVFNLHSDQIEVLMDVGVVGYIPFLGFWIVLLSLGWKAMMLQRSLPRQLALAYFGSVFYAFVDTFMHGGFLSAGGGVSAFSWTMIALFLATTNAQLFVPQPSSEPLRVRTTAPTGFVPIPTRHHVNIRSSLPSVRKLRSIQ
jgi:O-antigen ligase